MLRYEILGAEIQEQEVLSQQKKGILNKKLDKITKILMHVISENNYQGEFDEETEIPKPKKTTKRK